MYSHDKRWFRIFHCTSRDITRRCSLCVVELLLLSVLSESPFHVESSALLLLHLFWSAEMAIATIVSIPTPHSFVHEEARLTSTLLMKLPLHKAWQRHLFHQRTMRNVRNVRNPLHLSFVVLFRVNLRVSTRLAARHQDLRRLRAGHRWSLVHFTTSRFVDVGGKRQPHALDTKMLQNHGRETQYTWWMMKDDESSKCRNCTA